MQSEKVSIVIPCREVDALTSRCITVCQEMYPGTEIIVVPDTDLPKGTHLEGVVVLPSGSLNPVAKRNMAVRAAHGEFLALIDSDSYPVDWVAGGGYQGSRTVSNHRCCWRADSSSA